MVTETSASEVSEESLQEQVSETEQASEGVVSETQEQDWRSIVLAHKAELLQEADIAEEINRRAQSLKDKELHAERLSRQKEADNKRLQELADMDETELGELVKRDPQAARLLATRLPVSAEVIQPILAEYFGAANLHLLNKLPEEQQRNILAEIAKKPQEEQRFETFADMVIEIIADAKAEEKAKKLAVGLVETEVKKRLADTRSGERSPDLTPYKAGGSTLTPETYRAKLERGEVVSPAEVDAMTRRYLER